MRLIKEILHNFWIPIAITTSFLFFMKYLNIQDEESQRIVFSVILGVLLGFTADITKQKYDDFTQERKLKQATMRLLKEDAKSIYRSVWLWDRLVKSSSVPDDVKKHIPAELSLRYWDKLKENNDFLMLAAEEPFTSIFKEIYDFEEINNQIRLAKTGNNQAHSFAIAFYRIAADEKSHKKLLLFFMNEQEIADLDKKYIEASMERQKK